MATNIKIGTHFVLVSQYSQIDDYFYDQGLYSINISNIDYIEGNIIEIGGDSWHKVYLNKSSCLFNKTSTNPDEQSFYVITDEDFCLLLQ